MTHLSFILCHRQEGGGMNPCIRREAGPFGVICNHSKQLRGDSRATVHLQGLGKKKMSDVHLVGDAGTGLEWPKVTLLLSLPAMLPASF